MAGAGRGHRRVDDQHPPVVRRHSGGQRGDLVAVGAVERGDQAAAASRHEIDCFVERAVRHERAHRAERFDGVDGRARRVVRPQQNRPHESPDTVVCAAASRRADRAGSRRLEPAASGTRIFVGAEGGFRRLPQRGYRGGHLVALGKADERAHGGGLVTRIAYNHLGQRGGERVGGGVEVFDGHDGPADGGAPLARLDRHLLDDLGAEQVELGGAASGGGGQHGRVERVGFDVEPGGPLGDRGVGPQPGGGGGRSGEGDAVLPAEAVKQAVELAGRGAHQLQRALGHQAAVDDEAHSGLGQIGGRRGRLDDGRNAGDKGRCELLDHPPHREVEGIDLQLDAGAGREDVHGREGVVP